VDISPVPYFRRLGLGRGAAEQQASQGFLVQGKQGPEVAEAPEGRSGGR